MPTTRPFDYRTDPPRRMCAGSGRFPEYRVGTSGSCPVCRHQMNLGSDYFTTRVPEHVVLIGLRPNANPILDAMRDDDLGDDPWGTTIAWSFAACEVLYDADPNMVPSEVGYRPSLAGPEVPNGSDVADPYRITLQDLSFATSEVWCYLHDVDAEDPAASDADALPYWNDPTFSQRADALVFAIRCLSRYLDWLRAAGRDY